MAVLIVCLISFAISGIPFGLFIAQMLGGVDIREHGSGNIGATNVSMIVGAKAGILTFVADFAKGYLCVLLSTWLLVKGAHYEPAQLLVSESSIYGWIIVSVIAGTIFSIYLKGTGGKAIASGFGAVTYIAPLVAVILLIVWLTILATTRKVALASLAASAALPFLMLTQLPTLAFFLLMLAVSALLFWSHRDNIGELSGKTNTPVRFERRKPPVRKQPHKLDS